MLIVALSSSVFIYWHYKKAVYLKSDIQRLLAVQSDLEQKVAQAKIVTRLVDQKLLKFNERKNTLNTYNLKDTCLEICSYAQQQGVSLCSYRPSNNAALSADTIANKTIIDIQAPYHELIEFCSQLNKKFPHIRCTLESLERLDNDEIKAWVVLESFSTYQKCRECLR